MNLQFQLMQGIFKDPKIFEDPFKALGAEAPKAVSCKDFSYQLVELQDVQVFKVTLITKTSDVVSTIDHLFKTNSVVIIDRLQQIHFCQKGYRVLREERDLCVLFRGILNVDEIRKEIQGKSRLRKTLEEAVFAVSALFLTAVAIQNVKEIPITALLQRLSPLAKEGSPILFSLLALFIGATATRYV